MTVAPVVVCVCARACWCASVSKALNGGQYPLSVLALGPEAAATYVVGTYGNTMTTNPKALDVAHAVLSNVTPAVRRSVPHCLRGLSRGCSFVQRSRSAL